MNGIGRVTSYSFAIPHSQLVLVRDHTLFELYLFGSLVNEDGVTILIPRVQVTISTDLSFLPSISALPLIETFRINFDIEDTLTVELEIFTLDNKEYPTWIFLDGYRNSIRHYEDRNITGKPQSIATSKFVIPLNTTDLGEEDGPIVRISLGFSEPATDTWFLFLGHVNLTDKRDPALSTESSSFIFDTKTNTPTQSPTTAKFRTSSIEYYYFPLIFILVIAILRRAKIQIRKNHSITY